MINHLVITKHTVLNVLQNYNPNYFLSIKLNLKILPIKYSKINIKSKEQNKYFISKIKSQKDRSFKIGVIEMIKLILDCLILHSIIDLIGDRYITLMIEYCIYSCDQECQKDLLLQGLWISGFLGIMAMVIAIYQINSHLSNFTNPFFQSKIVMIIFMAPFYAITSIVSTLQPQIAQYIVLVRDAYQAILLFVFFYLICAYLAFDYQRGCLDSMKLYHTMLQHQKEVPHFFPFKYCQKPYQLTSWQKAKYFTYRCKKWILQFLIVKPLSALLLILIKPFEQQKWAIIFTNFIHALVCLSISLSLYYLVLFYHALQHPLSPYSPLLKFLTIKITLFFTFWQKIAIEIFKQPVLSCFNQKAQSFNGQKIVLIFQNLLICLEMTIMALVASCAYSVSPYIVKHSQHRGTFGDVWQDIINTFRGDSRLIKAKKFGYQAYGQGYQMKQLRQSLLQRKSLCFLLSSQPIENRIIQNYV